MILSLRLQNFRSYASSAFEFSISANVIVGANAKGKTNILEAILVSRSGSSYRAKDTDLIMFNKPWARIDVDEDGSNRAVKIERDKIPAKTFDINGKLYKRLPASQRLPVVLFEPNHLQLLNGSPEGRRNYLDSLLEQLNVEYGPLLRKYGRALAQRNSLLKDPKTPTTNQLFPWNIRLSQLGGQIVKKRAELISQLNLLLPKIYKDLSSSTLKTALIYKPQMPAINYESHFLQKLEANIDDDLRSGFTGVGPHRDDFSLTYNSHISNIYASRGELRTAVLGLKICEMELISKQGVRPAILLDDVYSELDGQRRRALTDYIKDNQSFITTTDADVVVKQLSADHQVIALS